MVKKLEDMCLQCIGQNLNSISQVGRLLPTKHKEILLQRLADHDMLTPDYLPHVTYHLFSPALHSVKFKGCEQVTDAVLMKLNDCKCQLESLYIGRCKMVTDVGLQALLSKQTSLKKLTLKNLPQITCKALEAVCCPDTLVDVKILCSNISNKGIQSLVTKNPKICKLSFGTPTSKASDDVVPVCASALGSNLIELVISDLNTLSDKSLVSIGENCPNLIRICLMGCNKFTSEGLMPLLSGCSKLQELDLSFCYKALEPSSSNVLEHLPTSITSLSLSGLPVDGATLHKALVRLTKLSELRLCGINNITEEDIEEIFSGIGSELTLLDLTRCHQSLTDHALRSVLKYCTELEDLSISGCARLTGEAFINLIRDPRRAKNLTSLKLNGVKEISHSILIGIATSCPNLETVYLAGLKCVDDALLFDLATNCPKLSNISIKSSTGKDSHQVTDAGLLDLVRCCTLQHVVISGIHKITDRCVLALANSCPDLKSLYASGCTMITFAGIRYLKDMCNNRVHVEHKIPNLDPNQVMAKNLDTGEFCRVDQMH
ncbi:F-box/LRR-repeat protein 20-like [Patiria miniata]|uniref:F-box/LRR-repeat protein 15-like leucin rich repeat domain-containing protein n=1 Tax=Patiria miniata TaxID=46514 RepID=A0A913Z3S6_PATMI|nr:F-box/LRR-repeat protein 20-like [Patiria miniata]XP_038046357.1 F-box/LRR-repeat protein 20-like [Patiria miniata]